jgi:hypothetical protein
MQVWTTIVSDFLQPLSVCCLGFGVLPVTASECPYQLNSVHLVCTDPSLGAFAYSGKASVGFVMSVRVFAFAVKPVLATFGSVQSCLIYTGGQLTVARALSLVLSAESWNPVHA